jgi:hypothetical protein
MKIFKSLILTAAAMAVAQTAAAAPAASYLTQQDLQTGVAAAPADANLFVKTLQATDTQHAHFSFDIMRRLKGEGRGLLHSVVTEIYEIKEGGGTLLTGGSLTNPKPMRRSPDTATIGPSLEGTAIAGGQSRHVKAGDIVIIPPGTPHMFTALDGKVVYLVIRVEPH